MLCRVVLPSETYAQKAQRVLAANGYHSEIIRSTSRGLGCGYSLRAAGDCETIRAILSRENIPVQNVRDERGML